MKAFRKLIFFTFLAYLLFASSAFAEGSEFTTCNENGVSTGTVFSKATINVSNVDMSGNYLYFGIDAGIFKKTESVGDWLIIYQQRVPTNSLKVQITDFGDLSKFENGQVYTLGYRVLYTMLDSEDETLIETDWKRIEGSYFKLNSERQELPQAFSDVLQGHWAYQAISKMTELGVVSGCGDGTFRPDKKVTREQFAKMMVLALNIPIVEPENPTYQDINKEKWSFRYIETARRYLSGYARIDGFYYDGENEVSREDVACALVKAKGYQNEKVDTLRLNSIYKDRNDISPKMAKYVLIAYDKNLLSGYDDGTFRPKRALTRAEAAELLYNAIK